MTTQKELLIPLNLVSIAPLRGLRSASARLLLLGLIATIAACGPLGATPALADFGVTAFDGSLANEAGQPYTQAGGHPYTASTTIDFARKPDPETGLPTPDGNVKDIHVDLPPGFAGDPTATPRCTQAQFHEFAGGECPPASQVGTVTLTMGFAVGTKEPTNPVYNLVPPPGVPAQFGLAFPPAFVVLDASVRTGSDYGLSIDVRNSTFALPLMGSKLTFWGDPADPSHDPERACRGTNGQFETGCSSGIASPKPFLTLPTACLGPQTTTMRADSWQSPGAFATASFVSHDNLGNPIGASGCDALDFKPRISIQPDTSAADSPTGLHVDLRIPQNENPEQLATAQLKKAVIALPSGVAVNPSAANGLGSCSEAQIDLHGSGAADCPDSSKLGTVEVATPLLDHPLPGAVYLAKQGENPFHSLLALYIAVDDPISGVVVKLPGKVELNQSTGQLTATFDDNPQLPFEDLKVDFFGGPRAPLTTPPTCGTFSSESEFAPWSGTPPVKQADAFPISRGANGSSCIGTEAQASNAPFFEAGTRTPIAGLYSPFVLRLARQDGAQRFGAVNLSLPPGLTGRLAGIPYCPDAALAAAAAKSGAEEQGNPSCSPASEVGAVTVGAGAGSDPVFVDGKAYLAGPYKGAPLSLAIVTPAVAGPFDLGTVVVRSALFVDRETAQITIKSDPIPSILQGIPLNIRDIRISVNRRDFTLNPTSCEAMSVGGEAVSTLGQAAPLTNRFQVGGCRGLDFKPRLALRVFGKTNRNAKPRLRAVLRAKPDEANLRFVQVSLPHSEFLEQNHIKTICTRVQFAKGNGNGSACPKGSIYGYAKAWTPLLDKPLGGPVFLRANGGERELPDLVAALDGQVDITLWGKVDSGRNGGLRNTFEVVPDAPVSKFILEMRGGKKGLLVNSENLCSPNAKRRAIVRLVGQNGKVRNFKPKVANQCKKH